MSADQCRTAYHHVLPRVQPDIGDVDILDLLPSLLCCDDKLVVDDCVGR